MGRVQGSVHSLSRALCPLYLPAWTVLFLLISRTEKQTARVVSPEAYVMVASINSARKFF